MGFLCCRKNLAGENTSQGLGVVIFVESKKCGTPSRTKWRIQWHAYCT